MLGANVCRYIDVCCRSTRSPTTTCRLHFHPTLFSKCFQFCFLFSLASSDANVIMSDNIWFATLLVCVKRGSRRTSAHHQYVVTLPWSVNYPRHTLFSRLSSLLLLSFLLVKESCQPQRQHFAAPPQHSNASITSRAKSCTCSVCLFGLQAKVSKSLDLFKKPFYYKHTHTFGHPFGESTHSPKSAV